MVLSDQVPREAAASSQLPDYNSALAMPTASPSPRSLHRGITNSPAQSPRTNSTPPLVPADWEERSKNGKKYYADLTTRTTHWPPPKGWRVKKHTDGRIYYVHIETHSSHWYLPPSHWEVCKSQGGNVYFFDTKTKEMHTKVPRPADPNLSDSTDGKKTIKGKKAR